MLVQCLWVGKDIECQLGRAINKQETFDTLVPSLKNVAPEGNNILEIRVNTEKAIFTATVPLTYASTRCAHALHNKPCVRQWLW